VIEGPGRKARTERPREPMGRPEGRQQGRAGKTVLESVSAGIGFDRPPQAD
jgi:hypothetical protein